MKNTIAKLLFGAWTVLSAGLFAACVDDNDDNGMPFIEVNPETLVCSLDGNFEGGGNYFEVKSNRAWTLIAGSGSEWIEFEPKQGGEGTTKVELLVPSSNEGRVGTLTFQLANAYSVYMTKSVSVHQGEIPAAGPVAALVAYIKENLASTSSGTSVDLNYSEPTVEAVILANNQYGNNSGKLYVGDNTIAPNSAIVLYDLGEFTKDKSAAYPVGKKVTLDLSGAKYAPYGNLRELKGVGITVSDEDPVEVAVPTLTAAQFNTGNYQGQYVKITGVTPQADFVGQAWVTSAKRSVKLTADGMDIQTYMATASEAPDFDGLLIAAQTGAIWGTAEQNFNNIQIIPTKPEDVLELTAGGDQPAVTTGAATAVTAASVTLSGSSRNIDNATEVGVAYKVNDATEVAPTLVPAVAVATEWSVEVTGLTEGTTYMYYAYAKVGDTEIKGVEKTFTTKTVSDADISVDFTVSDTYPSGFPAGKAADAKKELATYSFAGHDFALYGAESGYYRANASEPYYLMLGKQGAYLELPAVAGKSLTKVIVKSRDGGSANVRVSVCDTSNAVIEGGEEQQWNNTSDYTYVYNLSGTAMNTPYRLYIANGYNAQFTQLDLYYTEGGAISLSPKTSELTFEPDETTAKTVEYTFDAETGGLTVAIDSDQYFTVELDADGKTVKVTPKSANDSDSPRTAAVTVTLTDKTDASRTATATISVTQASATPQPISSVIAGGKDKNLAIAGQIVGINTSGFIVKDDTGLLFVYLNAQTTHNVGDNVKVYGTTSEYAGLVQLTATESSVTLVSSGTYTQPEPEVLDAAAIDAYVAGTMSIKYVKYAGTLSISGSNYIVTVAGTSVKPRLQYVPAGVVDASLNGAAVIVTGYAMGGTSTNLNTLVIAVEKDESAPASTVLAQWAFASKDALNATGGDTNSVISRVGVTTALSYTGSSGSIYCNGWDGADQAEKYWLLTIPHSEAIPAAAKLTVAWNAWGTATSPKSWFVEYSTDNAAWERIATVSYTTTNNDSHTETIIVPSEIVSGTLYIRFKVDGTTSIGNGTAASNGNSRMANIKISYE